MPTMAGRRGGRARGLTRWLRLLGPGLITGTSDDDPSGITTDSIAGASFGYDLLWTAAAGTPPVTAVQLVCAANWALTGQGVIGAAQGYYPRWALGGAPLLLLVADGFNIAAELAGMAKVTETPQRAPPRLADSDALTTTGRPLILELSRTRGRGHPADPGTRRAGEHVLEDAPTVTPRTPLQPQRSTARMSNTVTFVIPSG
jgi:hypothetical protein